MEFVNTGSLLNEELFDLFLLLASLESQKEWIQVTQEIEDKLEQMYSLTEYQKAEQHWMTIFFVLNFLVDLLPFQYHGEVVGSLLTRPSTKQNHWLLTLWVSDQWQTAVAEPIINALQTSTTFISLIWQGQITVKYLGTVRSMLSLDFGERDLFSGLHLSVTELDTRHVGCHMAMHNHFLERVPAFGCGKLFSTVKTFQRKYFGQYSSYVCGTCEQISIRRPGPAYICNRCDSRPALLRCEGCKICESGGVNNCSGFVLPSGDRFECGNFCRIILITNKEHY